MAQLPVISGLEAVQAFQRAGWRISRQKGSHIILVKQGEIASLSIPDHKTLDRGTLRSLIRKAGMSVEDFIEFL
ncbi:HicA toxin of bacterial toxin-antitoxin [Neomoorella glycerini]|uniref:HicA toxin of bacterial toxin-antitoxin n=1 Tax=Neomoorella glycerini TaxID=55779 RepID=A0A6I5ZWI3_9FIRM|nr:type II toxin-antitoxin system HicA family toxin [Moorella glycerini]QGP93938.1 HicA toxin of bacterial toxin-antitoxin [Moorella glycerini]